MDDDQDGRGVSLLGVGAGVFVLVLVVAAVVILIAKPGSGHSHKATSTQPQSATPGTSQTQPASSSTTSSTTTVAAKPGVCTLPAGSQGVPSASPPSGTSWGQVGEMVVPQAKKTLGPQWQQGQFTTCFAHSPSGALLSAINLWAMGTTVPDGRLMRHYSVGAPAAAYRPRTTLGDTQFAGYKYGSYSASSATVYVVLKQPTGGLEAIRTTMVWRGGSVDDWRYQFPPAGDPAVEGLDNSTVTPPYIAWSDFGN